MCLLGWLCRNLIICGALGALLAAVQDLTSKVNIQFRFRSHFVYICSDLALELLPLKRAIIHKRYTLQRNIPLKRTICNEKNTLKMYKICLKSYPGGPSIGILHYIGSAPRSPHPQGDIGIGKAVWNNN